MAIAAFDSGSSSDEVQREDTALLASASDRRREETRLERHPKIAFLVRCRQPRAPRIEDVGFEPQLRYAPKASRLLEAIAIGVGKAIRPAADRPGAGHFPTDYAPR